MKESQKKIKKLFSAYERAMKAVNDIEYGARSIGKVDREVQVVAKMVLLALRGRGEEATFNIGYRRPKLKADWAKHLTREALVSTINIINGDGHKIVAPVDLWHSGLPRQVINAHVNIYSSDVRNPKAALFDKKGNLISSVKGVYSLDLLRNIARSLEVTPYSSLGRGSEARELTARIRTKIEELFPRIK